MIDKIMPRGRPKLIGPLLPKGGTRALNTKQRLADKEKAFAELITPMPAIPAKRGRKKVVGPLLPKGGTRALNTKKRLAAKDAALANYAETLNSPQVSNSVVKVVKAKRQASAAQLAALEKARVARAQKSSATKAEREAN